MSRCGQVAKLLETSCRMRLAVSALAAPTTSLGCNICYPVAVVVASPYFDRHDISSSVLSAFGGSISFVSLVERHRRLQVHLCCVSH